MWRVKEDEMGPRSLIRRLTTKSREDIVIDFDQPGMAGGGGGGGGGRRRGDVGKASLLTRVVDAIFSFVRLAEFEILFFVFFIVAFLMFKDLKENSRRGALFANIDWNRVSLLTSRPEYNQIFVKKPPIDDDSYPF